MSVIYLVDLNSTRSMVLNILPDFMLVIHFHFNGQRTTLFRPTKTTFLRDIINVLTIEFLSPNYLFPAKKRDDFVTSTKYITLSEYHIS